MQPGLYADISAPIVFKESRDAERERLGLGEEGDFGQFSGLSERGRIRNESEK
mgnify:CR=1 FL=1